MTIFYWIYGVLLAAIWLRHLIDLNSGLPRIPNVSLPEWDRSPAHPSRVSVIVPARNEEADIEDCLRSLAAMDYPQLEVIAVNDRSTDRTGEIMDRVAADSGGRIRVVHVSALPERWLGKTHAMWVAAKQATGDWLLFTDGDVTFRRDAIRRAMIYLEETGADHLIMMPHAVLNQIGERVMIGCLQVISMSAPGHRAWKTADPKSRDYVGVGAFNLVSRAAYEKVGTFERLRLTVVEDLNLGRLIKEQGFSQHVVLGQDLLSLYWAKGAGGIVKTLSKNLFAILRFQWWFAALAVLALCLVHLGPFVGVLVAPGWAKSGFALALAAIFLVYARISEVSGVSPAFFFTHPIGTLLLAYAIIRSTIKTLWLGGVVWRDTRYSLQELRKAR